MNSHSDRSSMAAWLAFLFSGVTSALQPARFSLALLAVVLVTALVPVVDRLDGQAFGPRGLSAGPLSGMELELNLQRARNAASRVARAEVDELERAARASDGANASVSRSDLARAVRAATASAVGERLANGIGSDDAQIRGLRERAAEAMLIIEETAPRGVASAFLAAESVAIANAARSVLALNMPGLLGAVGDALFQIPRDAVRASPLWFPMGTLATLALLSVLAGGSCRMAAVHAGRCARLSPLEGSGFARMRALRLLAIPLLPALVLFLLALVPALFALLLRVPILNVIGGALFIVPILVGLLATVLAVTVVAAFPLMPAAVAVEDCDTGDAITRAGALVLARPLLWIGTLLASLAVLVVGCLVVGLVVELAGSALEGMLGMLGGPLGEAFASGSRSELSALFGVHRLVGAFVGLWLGLLSLSTAAYGFTLFCDLATRGYLLMRERIDGEHIGTVAGYGIG